jgi:hypothetical protein
LSGYTAHCPTIASFVTVLIDTPHTWDTERIGDPSTSMVRI